jgi:hypothetical protein
MSYLTEALEWQDDIEALIYDSHGRYHHLVESVATAFDAARKYVKLLELVAEQAEDEGLWFRARTAPEAYLQQKLRRLHALIEEGTE